MVDIARLCENLHHPHADAVNLSTEVACQSATQFVHAYYQGVGEASQSHVFATGISQVNSFEDCGINPSLDNDTDPTSTLSKSLPEANSLSPCPMPTFCHKPPVSQSSVRFRRPAEPSRAFHASARGKGTLSESGSHGGELAPGIAHPADPCVGSGSGSLPRRGELSANGGVPDSCSRAGQAEGNLGEADLGSQPEQGPPSGQPPTCQGSGAGSESDGVSREGSSALLHSHDDQDSEGRPLDMGSRASGICDVRDVAKKGDLGNETPRSRLEERVLRRPGVPDVDAGTKVGARQSASDFHPLLFAPPEAPDRAAVADGSLDSAAEHSLVLEALHTESLTTLARLQDTLTDLCQTSLHATTDPDPSARAPPDLCGAAALELGAPQAPAAVFSSVEAGFSSSGTASGKGFQSPSDP